MRRCLVILTCFAALVAFALFGSYGGQQIVGFRYGVVVDNLASDYPNRIVTVVGRRLTLDDGRVLVVAKEQTDLCAAMRDSRTRVRFDPADQALYTAQHVAFCSFDRPQRCQVFTIPLKRVELRKYASRQVADARLLPSSGG